MSKPYVVEPEAAEAWAAWRVVDLSNKMAWRKIHLEGDALGIVQAFNRETNRWGSYGVVVQDAK
jgi:hypothetical protein